MVDDGRRTTDGQTPDHGHPISSPCEPDGSGELKILKVSYRQFNMQTNEYMGATILFTSLIFIFLLKSK